MPYKCPRCEDSYLKEELFNKKISFTCEKCHGYFITIHALNSFPQAKEFTKLLWQGAKYGDYPNGIKCPECGQFTKQVTFEINNQDVDIDICTSCQFVWFDHQELNYVNTKTDEDELPQKFKEIVARRKVEMEENKSENTFYVADEKYFSFSDYLLSLLNLPIEENQSILKTKPIITWFLCALITIIFFLSLIDKNQIVNTFGFIPNQAFRFYGITIITSALLHSNIFHLLGNLYFLFIFGDNVEDFLGKKKYILLIILSEIGSTILHCLLEPKNNIPLIGSSGFISGILAAYTILFPKVKLAFRLFYNNMYTLFTTRHLWISLPVWLVFSFWIITQIILSIYSSKSHVAYFAHLGGILVGSIFVVIYKVREKSNFVNNKVNNLYTMKNKAKDFDNKTLDSSSYR